MDISRACKNQTEGVKISDVSYKNMRGTSSTDIAINFMCSETVACTRIHLQDIRLGSIGQKKTTSAYCFNAHGSIDGIASETEAGREEERAAIDDKKISGTKMTSQKWKDNIILTWRLKLYFSSHLNSGHAGMEFKSPLMHHDNGRSYSSLVCHLFQHFFIFLLPFSTAAIDFISRNQSLVDGQTIVSPGERFELGFFSPGSTKNRYVGVWYKNISVPTVVWVANRENPVTDTSGILSVDGHGNLVVLDGNRAALWSCNASAVFKNSTAVLNDSGNLILQEEASPTKILWQSFENPSDTFLPTTRLGFDLNAGRRQYLTSWKSESDPSPGVFSLGMELPEARLPQIFLYNGSSRIWRSGYWNGQIFIGISTMDSYTSEGKLSVDYQERGMYVTYDESYIARFVVDWTGSLKQPVWHEDSKEWLIQLVEPEKQCDVYGTCGAFGSCDSSKAPPICSCLNGFQPKRVEEWESGNWASGCVRRTQLQCNQEAENTTTSGSRYADDEFLKIGGVKPPDLADWRSDETASDCEQTCLSNCSCVAFADVNGIGCMLWALQLIDIQQFPSGGVDLFIRLAGSEIGESYFQLDLECCSHATRFCNLDSSIINIHTNSGVPIG
ncbi:hypothetical protein ACLOJK_039725 [Asimina triloba]